MKRTLSLILALVMALSLAACGKKDDGKTDNADAPADSLALLTKVWDSYTDDEKFPAAGGDEAHDNMEGAGEFDISVYGDSFQAQILVDEELTAMVKPQAATMLHMMNTNTFCSAVMQLNDAADAEAFASHYQQIVQSHHWMCGFPDTVVVLRMTDYVITAYGADDLIQAFKTAAQGLGAEVLVEAPAEA